LAHGQITIAPGGTSTTIINNLIGSGITINNVVINCGGTSYGVYTGNLQAGGSTLSNGGIILSTGNASTAVGPNSSGSTSGVIAGYDFSDPDLTTQPGAGSPAPNLDNCVLEFDMVPVCTNLNVSFVFGSEEYPEFVNSTYNDGFGIFVSGPNPTGGFYTAYNMARLPNGQLVSIDNVNVNANSQYYNTNTNNVTSFDAYTDGLTATIDVVPCNIYHVKIIIADAGDQSWDSALFLGYHSFTCTAPAFTLNSSFVAATCAQAGSATVTVSGGVGPFIYTWLNDPFETSNTLSNLSGGSYTVTVTDQGNCNTQQTVTIDVPGVVVPTISGNGAVICQGETVTLTANSPNTGGNFQWSDGSTLATFTFSPNADTTVFVNYLLNGCASDTLFLFVQVDQAIQGNPSVNMPLCEGDLMQLTVANFPGATYQWTGPNGFFSAVQNPSLPAITTNATGTYDVFIQLGVCSNTLSVDVVIDAQTPSVIDAAGPFCSYDSAVDLQSNTEPGVWSGMGIVDNTTGLFDPTQANIGNNVVTFNSDAYCTSSYSISINVIAPLVPTINPIASYCDDANDQQLTAVTPGGNWSSTNANITASGIISPSALVPGNYTVNYQLNNQGCLSEDSASFTILPLPTLSFDVVPTEGCVPFTATFTNTSISSTTSCEWFVDGVPIGSDCTSHDFEMTNVGCVDVLLVSTDGQGCTNSVSLTDATCGTAQPTASFTWFPTTPSSANPQIQLSNLSLGNLTNSWYINGETFTDENPVYHLPPDLPEYFDVCLTVTGNLGCQDSVCYVVPVDLEEFVFVPNCFTPNNDGVNDVFMPVVSGLDDSNPSYEFIVVNRWGEIVFRTTTPNEAWNGNVRNGAYFAVDGVYQWYVSVKLQTNAPTTELQGHVTLSR